MTRRDSEMKFACLVRSNFLRCHNFVVVILNRIKIMNFLSLFQVISCRESLFCSVLMNFYLYINSACVLSDPFYILEIIALQQVLRCQRL